MPPVFDRLQYAKRRERAWGISSRDLRHNRQMSSCLLSTAKWYTRPTVDIKVNKLLRLESVTSAVPRIMWWNSPGLLPPFLHTASEQNYFTVVVRSYTLESVACFPKKCSLTVRCWLNSCPKRSAEVFFHLFQIVLKKAIVPTEVHFHYMNKLTASHY